MLKHRVYTSAIRAYTTSPSDLKQEHLEAVIHDIFPDKHIITNARRSANIVSPFTGFFLELDYWIPDIKLAFEFQDPYHYVSTWYANKTLAYIKKRDTVKKQEVEDRGETLISVPCWWDGEKESLIATIRQRRKDLLTNFQISAKPIEDIPPSGFFKVGKIPDVGEVMQATFIESNVCYDSWWMNEKYDGVRGCWNPVYKTLHGRYGTLLRLPESLLLNFPGCFLDGEVWFGRRSFRQAREVVSKNSQNSAKFRNFESFRFVAFDCPNPVLHASKFEARFGNVVATPHDHPFIMIAALHKCKDPKHAKKFANEILESGGEGIVLREPESFYIHGKSSHLLKVKAHRVDQEALVTSEMDNGEYLLKLPNGVEFTAKNSASDDDLPITGDVVTFAYKQYISGKFIGAQILCVRSDLEWENVLADSGMQVTKKQQVNNSSKRALAPPSVRRPTGHWTSDDGINTKLFFDNFAKRRKFDPLVAENWYSFIQHDFLQEPDGKAVLTKYSKSFVRALLDIYPSIGLDRAKFANVVRNFWKEPQNRRKFFDDFAEKYDFEPLVPANWYSFSHRAFIVERGGASIMVWFENNVPSALKDAYPDIGLDETKFINLFKNIFNMSKNRKRFLDYFSSKHKFNPFEAENWYGITADMVRKEKGGSAFLDFYKDNLPNAIIDIYPSIGINKTEFNVGRRFWRVKENQKAFFDLLADRYRIDPLIPSNWYNSISKNIVLKRKGGMMILGLYAWSLAKALQNIYPQLGFMNDEEFDDVPLAYWRDPKNRRKFFDEFAAKRGFDPLIVDNWYLISLKDVLDEKGGSKIIYQHSTLVRALRDLYPELHFKEKKFVHVGRNHWMFTKNRKIFFDDFAKSRNFDPLVPQNWYRIQTSDIVYSKSGSSVLSYYDNSIVKALTSVYPDIGLDKRKFIAMPRKFWASLENKREFFDKIAKNNNFDPLNPENWYKLAKRVVKNEAGGLSMLKTYNGSLSQALVETYKEIHWDLKQFSQGKFVDSVKYDDVS